MIDRDNDLPPFCRRGLLIGTNGGAVDHLDVAIMRGADSVHQPIPDTGPPPSHKAVVTGGARSIAFWQVAPWCSRSKSPADYSVDLCVGTDQPIEANNEQIKAGEIPGGRCAVLRVVGNTDNLEPAALYLYRDWLPASGEEARDFPIYCQRLSFFPEVPEHEAVAELFLPLK